jgi:hypothetical protein
VAEAEVDTFEVASEKASTIDESEAAVEANAAGATDVASGIVAAAGVSKAGGSPCPYIAAASSCKLV